MMRGCPQHHRGHCTDQHGLGHPLRAVATDAAGDFVATLALVATVAAGSAKAATMPAPLSRTVRREARACAAGCCLDILAFLSVALLHNRRSREIDRNSRVFDLAIARDLR
jgi:hypothetical protein